MQIDTLLSSFLILLISFVIAEIVFYMWISFVRKHFQWIITTQDEIPELSEEGLSKFIPQGYDSELGWIRKPNTSGTETNESNSSKWSINSKGYRSNPKFITLDSKISCFGDSFTFCRQVNDDETWEYHLSKLQNTNVQNFGVGNYGIDQSLLRLKREFPNNPTDLVILGVVPDTISRILSYWKHYSEYGNTFAFKPKFILKDNELHLQNNIIDHESKFNSYSNYISKIRNLDYFYTNKFKKEILNFPFSLNIFKNFKRNFSILYWVTKIQMLDIFHKDISNIKWNPMKIIMNINLKWRIKLYQNDKVTELFFAILNDYVLYSKKQNFKPIFLFLPQKDDLLFIKNNYHFFQNFLEQIKIIDGLFFIDITEQFLKITNLDELYSDDNEYGGHLSNKGNQMVASIINDAIFNYQT